jgi:hypothetical protein
LIKSGALLTEFFRAKLDRLSEPSVKLEESLIGPEVLTVWAYTKKFGLLYLTRNDLC